ncbi:MAG: HEAT repeat domain-containing protein [Deltaproteobacteria bacterium]|nr:HEAT repeat domain-containing protein [Deltaproteobacteria bacterium]
MFTPGRWSRRWRIPVLGAALLGGLLLLGADDEQEADELYASLTDPRYKIRIQAAAALASRQDRYALSALEQLLGDSEPLVRAAACDALMAQGDPAVLATLERLASDPDNLVRKRARLAVRVLAAQKKNAARSGGGAVAIENVSDVSQSGFTGLDDAMRGGLSAELASQEVALRSLTRSYTLLAQVRAVERNIGDDESSVRVRCQLTVAELPKRTLRLSTQVTANAAVDGRLAGDELIATARDAARNAGAELGREFAHWAVAQPPPNKVR